MQTRTLGASGITATVYALGCMPLGGGSGWGAEDEQEGIDTTPAAVDLGLTISAGSRIR